MITELLSQSINAPTPTASPGSDEMEPKLIQMLHAPPSVCLLRGAADGIHV